MDQLDNERILKLHHFVFFDVLKNTMFEWPKKNAEDRLRGSDPAESPGAAGQKAKIDDNIDLMNGLMKNYYNLKGKKASELVSMLDTMLVQRPQSMQQKKRNLVLAEPALHGLKPKIKKKNFLIDFCKLPPIILTSSELMRLGAEKDRTKMFRAVAERYVQKYNQICKKLTMANLENSNYGRFFTDHMKNIVETGVEYSTDFFFNLCEQLQDEEIDIGI